ncbi:MAG TPA: aspartyl-phosphate phosphatase Spo0E family protein [Bacillota bacterium]|nr:aspartyl-phosphate phosphatase Spo0E family protein [Bacillota bacterium]HQI17313.1 aspartyl-phosphate phosphatase Spo0E family protein [Bacillota bacterium]HQJ37951.1 aspartyl-phosphate phosphatase Spo0E family protein [Bacillota bacterium]HQL35289.1 aspartyl-phosphate phosphatase Spo0E family protein [Bacillota bacterium]HRS22062.1 aspartyl-phosphate phosphatase Spo0E family protein [Clostridia bacterium]
MADIDAINSDIEVLRDMLMSLIHSKGDLLNAEVLEASIRLDNALYEHNRLLYRGSSCNNNR